MANKREIAQLEKLIESTKATSAALAPIFSSASLALKYMSDAMTTLLADLVGRTPITEMQRSGTRYMESVLHAEEDARRGTKEEQPVFSLAREQDALFGRAMGGEQFDLAREQDVLFGRVPDLAETQPTEKGKGRT